MKRSRTPERKISTKPINKNMDNLTNLFFIFLYSFIYNKICENYNVD